MGRKKIKIEPITNARQKMVSRLISDTYVYMMLSEVTLALEILIEQFSLTFSYQFVSVLYIYFLANNRYVSTNGSAVYSRRPWNLLV